MATPKLVRDKIPEIVAAQGKHMKTTLAHPSEVHLILRDKLREEVNELLNATSRQGVAEEMGDILTVLYAMADRYDFDWYDDVMLPMSEKADERGEFKAFLIWDGNEPTHV